MSGGHGHTAGSGHDAAHGHGAGHGHDAAGSGAHGAHGPAEIPAAPAERFISPARADFEQPWPGKGLLWPLFWTGFAGVLAVLAMSFRGPILHDAHGEHGAHGGAATPAHGTGEPGKHPEAPPPAGMAGHGG